ncbi:MAG: 2-amino-3,7-dideoxy-D-threo-hept-6-ulosonate synthase [Candidatus Geothermarchaeales archaeon]
MVSGKELRTSRITERGKMICVPMDHGISIGPVKGIKDIESTINRVQEGGATAVIVHKGIIKSLSKPPGLGLIMHLSGSTSLGVPNWKVRVGSVEEAVLLGVDGVSVHVNIGDEKEPEMLAKLGQVADDCDRWGMPFLAMMYPRGKNIKDPNDPEVVAHVTRVAGELGADIVKTTYTGDPDSFRDVVRSSPVPVVIAGGPKCETEKEVLEMVAGAMEAGAMGVTFGRNVFQHDKPTAVVRALSMVIKEGASVDEALEALK